MSLITIKNNPFVFNTTRPVALPTTVRDARKFPLMIGLPVRTPRSTAVIKDASIVSSRSVEKYTVIRASGETADYAPNQLTVWRNVLERIGKILKHNDKWYIPLSFANGSLTGVPCFRCLQFEMGRNGYVIAAVVNKIADEFYGCEVGTDEELTAALVAFPGTSRQSSWTYKHHQLLRESSELEQFSQLRVGDFVYESHNALYLRVRSTVDVAGLRVALHASDADTGVMHFITYADNCINFLHTDERSVSKVKRRYFDGSYVCNKWRDTEARNNGVSNKMRDALGMHDPREVRRMRQAVGRLIAIRKRHGGHSQEYFAAIHAMCHGDDLATVQARQAVRFLLSHVHNLRRLPDWDVWIDSEFNVRRGTACEHFYNASDRTTFRFRDDGEIECAACANAAGWYWVSAVSRWATASEVYVDKQGRVFYAKQACEVKDSDVVQQEKYRAVATRKSGFLGKKYNPNEPYVGIELEAQFCNGATRSIIERVHATINRPYGKWYFDFESDSSIGGEHGGVEMVSGYGPLAEHAKALAPLKRKPFQGMLRSHDATTCGLHVHVSRANASPLHTARLMEFMFSPFNAAVIVALARRYDNRYTRFYANENAAKQYLKHQQASIASDWSPKQKRAALEGHATFGEKYAALSLAHHDTFEFRAFRGTLRYSTIMACMEFCHALWYFARDRRTMTTPEFLKYIEEKDMLPHTAHLRSYLADKGFACAANRKPKTAAEYMLPAADAVLIDE